MRTFFCGVAAASTLATVFAAPIARADIAPDNAKHLAYTYEVANLAEHGSEVLVLYPRACGSDGKPLGDVDLAMNPQYASHMHDVDYEVITPGPHQIGKSCEVSSRVFTLPAAAFPKAARVAKADDWMLGLKKDDSYAVLPALDAIDIKARIKFFESDPRVRRASRAFDPVGWVRSSSPLASVHDILAIKTLAEKTFELAATAVVYRYADGKEERIPFTSDARPPPSRAGALRRPGGLFGGPKDKDDDDEKDAAPAAPAPAPAPAGPMDSASASASTPPGAIASAATPDSEPSSTPRVLIAVLVAVVVVGAIFAFRRKPSAG